jgi:YD repeat-containing protein
MLLQAATGERCRLTTNTMGQLQTFVASDNATTRFTYSGNTGLIESRDDAEGSRMYEYDEVGHLAAVVLSDGTRTTLSDGSIDVSGARVNIVNDVSTIVMTVGDTSTSLSHGKLLFLFRCN